MTATAIPCPADVAMDALRDVPSVGLDELDAMAALQVRTDRKYVLTAVEAGDLLSALAPAARVLEIGGVRDFAYASTYFDTGDLLAFRLAAMRRRRRFKVRTRAYLNTGAQFLEVKTRAGRGVTVKERCPHDVPARLGAGAGFVASCLAAAQVTGVEPGRLAPTLRSRYQRTTLLLPDARLTVDTDVAWTLLRPDGAPAGPRASVGGLMVVETKTGPAPSSADRLLWRAGHRPDRISKYATGMAVLRPELPDVPWRRLLRRHPDLTRAVTAATAVTAVATTTTSGRTL